MMTLASPLMVPTLAYIYIYIYIYIVRNTKGFVLYFLMRKYTSVPYIGSISVRYKCNTSTSVLYK